MTRVTANRVHGHVQHRQAALIAALTERYAGQRIRFDTGFDGTAPVLARGRIGRRFFFFRYRGDCATLTIGSPIHRNLASRAKHSRRKALRALRRSKDHDSLRGLFFLRRDLKRDTILDRHPSRFTWCAVINDVTGDRYTGSLEPEEAAELFIQLMSMLQLAAPTPKRLKFDATRRGSYTWPMGHTQGIIRKPSQTRR